jgi:hypothetical protein
MFCDDIIQNWTHNNLAHEEPIKWIHDLLPSAQKFVLSPSFVDFGYVHFPRPIDLLTYSHE